MTDNVFVEIDRAIEKAQARAAWVAQAPFDPSDAFDVGLVSRVAGWEGDAHAVRALELIEAMSGATVTSRTGRGVGLRLSDDALDAAVRRIQARPAANGGGTPERRRAVVYFCGANATKALHIGHLRDVAIGNSLSSALGASGMAVERRNLIADWGRGMGEAIAGVSRSGLADRSRAELPDKSDRFVGECYARYVKAQASAAADSDDDGDSLHREATLLDDSADAVLRRIGDGDLAAYELWQRTRDWVMTGQEETLARLRVTFDKTIFESEFLDEMSALSEVGAGAGLLSVREDGVLVYVTGHEELDEMPLARTDGLPTQHLRALGYWASAGDLDGALSIQVCGAEWVPHVACRQQLIDELARHSPSVNRVHPRHTVFHGMVGERGKRIVSSGEPLLIDDLVASIDRELDSVREERAAAGDGALLEHAAGRIALAFFLLKPLGKPVDVDTATFVQPRASLGWDLTRARLHCEEAVDDASADERDFRYTIVRAELLEHLVCAAAATFDVTPLARHASHFARWLVERKRSPRVARAAERVLDEIDRTLGLAGG